MPRPRSLDAHPREFFAFTEELLTHPSKTVDCGGPGPRRAFALRASIYHFWSRLRRVVDDSGHQPAALDLLAFGLRNAGKLPDNANGSLIRALYRVAANTAISIDTPAEGVNVVRFQPRSTTGLAALLAENMTTPPEPVAMSGSALLAELELDKDKLR